MPRPTLVLGIVSALLLGAAPLLSAPAGDPVIWPLRLPPGPGNPRNSEGDFVRLRDGRLLFVYSHFTGGGDDNATACLASRESRDGGVTWTTEDRVVVPNEGGMNVMSVSLLRLADGRLALFYCRKNSETDCRPVLRYSSDEAQTWSDATVCIPDDQVGYYVLNNDRAVQLSSGRVVLPLALHRRPDWPTADWDGTLMCYLSDDVGRSWRVSKDTHQVMDAEGKRVTAQEPGVIQLKDGRLLMFARTKAGCQYLSYSPDGGDTWTVPEPSNIFSPCSPATIERIPSTGDLVLVWNDHEKITPELRDKRTPLNVAISKDEGRTWQNTKILEDDPQGWYCYTAVEFVGDQVLLGYCSTDATFKHLRQTKLARFPVSWLYQP